MIVLTGATGFTGSFILKKLIESNLDQIRCFVRKTSDISLIKKYDIQITYGSFEDYDSLVKAFSGAHTLVNVASLGFGHAPNIIKACEECNIQRGIFFSTTAVFTSLNPKSKEIRIAAEEIIRKSNLNYTIIRPTMIYGTENDRNISRLIKYLNRLPIMPVFGSGEFLQQPVYVEDLATAVIQILKTNKTVNQEYNLAGKEPITYNQIINITGSLLNKNVFKIHVSPQLATKLLDIYAKISSKPLLKSEQILRLNENKNFNIKKAIEDFSYNPIGFEEGIQKEIKSIYRDNNKESQKDINVKCL